MTVISILCLATELERQYSKHLDIKDYKNTNR
jgi:hypothetical protein